MTFIPRVQFSIQPVQAVEVSIEDTGKTQQSLMTPAVFVKDATSFMNIHKTAENIQQHKIHSSSVVVTKANPDYFQNSAPEYPELAKQMRQEGLVILSVDVNRQGLPVSVEVIKSCGYRLLDGAALRAVRHWRFQPGHIGDLPVESRVTIPIRFRLEKM